MLLPSGGAYPTSLLEGSAISPPHVLTDCPPAVGIADIFSFTG